MRALVADPTASPALSLADVPEPAPGPGELLLDIEAALELWIESSRGQNELALGENLGDTAIVQIERTARSRAELDCNKVVLEQASGNLTVKSETVHGQGCESIQVVYRVLLSLPRHADVSIHGVSGPINIARISGVRSATSPRSRVVKAAFSSGDMTSKPSSVGP